MKSIEILITPSGKTTVETKGFQGSECRAATRFLEQALGQNVGEQLKPEFYAANIAPQSVHEGQ